MRVCTYQVDARDRVGVVAGDGTIVSVAECVPGAPDDVLGLISAGRAMWERVAVAAAKKAGGIAVERARLRAPIPAPRRNVFCVGWNYSEHFQEGKLFRAQGGAAEAPSEVPPFPSLFSKNPATVIGPDAAVLFPEPHSTELDWEVELAVVIGEGGIDIAEADAIRHVFGYTCANDVSVRDVQRRHGGQWFKGKNFDTHLPMGPWIVTADELDPSDLAVRTRVNGITKQDSRTKFMVFKIPRLIAEISAGCRLWPGDLIITGTPAGVGFARTPPEFMKPGDTVEVEVEGIGVLRNPVARRS